MIFINLDTLQPWVDSSVSPELLGSTSVFVLSALQKHHLLGLEIHFDTVQLQLPGDPFHALLLWDEK